jgi:hypothetical protein
MPQLDFNVVDAEPAKHAAAPLLYFKVAITQAEDPVPIQNISLQCQIRIDAKKRIYKPDEQTRLTDLFGEPGRWGQTLHSLLWTHANVTVPAFENDTVVDMPVPCSFDFNLAATKYFDGLEYGKIPLELMFSGSVFYRDADGGLAMDLLSWNADAKFRLPVTVWQDMMEHYYPNSNWLCLNRQVFDALHDYKRRHGYTGFDEALTSLLPDSKRAAS